jgi:hypothetical protein
MNKKTSVLLAISLTAKPLLTPHMRSGRRVNSAGCSGIRFLGVPASWRRDYSIFPFNPLETPWDRISLADNASKPRRE